MTPDTGPVVGFDLDMTLVDSAAGISATILTALAESGHDATPQQVWPLVGVPLETIIATLAPTADALAVTRRYRELYPMCGVPSTTLLPGALDALAAVRAAGGRVLVVSAKAEPAVRSVLAHVGLDRFVDTVAGGRFGAEKGVLLRDLGADVYVGDHPGDVEAARVGGAVAVAVATGPHTLADLRGVGADVVLAALTAFPDWLGAWVDDLPAGRVAAGA
jgi:phosphoglycolate phosphatase